MPAIRKKLPGETIFGGKAGAFVPFKIDRISSSSGPSPQSLPPYSDTDEGVDEEHPWVGQKRVARMQHQNEQFCKMAQKKRQADESKDD